MLAVANVVTLGADLGGMADVTHLLTGVSASVWTVVYAAGVAAVLLFLGYSKIERLLRWLCLALFAYVIAGFLAKPDWSVVAANTVVPRVQWTRDYLSTLVAILGATMSPYFLFWQASQAVEVEYSKGRRTVAQRKGATRAELEATKVDVFAGSFVSKMITYFITVTAAASLFTNGQREVKTVKDAAVALKPVAGESAFLLFAIGVLGTGLLAVPVLAGSCAYAWSEAMRWRASLEEKPYYAPKFYTVLLLAVVIGVGFIYAGFDAVQMLFWASVLNGILAPVCILLVVLLTTDGRLMQGRVSGGWMRLFGWMAFAVTAAAAVALIVSR